MKRHVQLTGSLTHYGHFLLTHMLTPGLGQIISLSSNKALFEILDWCLEANKIYNCDVIKMAALIFLQLRHAMMSEQNLT